MGEWWMDNRAVVYFALFMVQFSVCMGAVYWNRWQIKQLWSRVNDIDDKETAERREFKKEVREDLKEMRHEVSSLDKSKLTRGNQIVRP